MFVTRMVSNTEPVVPKVVTEKDDLTYCSDALLMIPTLNEEEAIRALVQEAQSIGFSSILVVDGFSIDKTREIAAESGAKVVLQDFGKGKGRGVRTGMREFISSNSQMLCIIDGDGTNDPTFMAAMVEQVRCGKADVLLGSRTRGPREPKAMNMLSLASNLIVSLLLGAKFRRLFTDVQTGYWVLTRNAVQRIYPQMRSTGFEVELELFVTSLKEGVRTDEMPVGFRRRRGHTKFSFMQRIRNLYYAFRFLVS